MFRLIKIELVITDTNHIPTIIFVYFTLFTIQLYKKWMSYIIIHKWMRNRSKILYNFSTHTEFLWWNSNFCDYIQWTTVWPFCCINNYTNFIIPNTELLNGLNATFSTEKLWAHWMQNNCCYELFLLLVSHFAFKR